MACSGPLSNCATYCTLYSRKVWCNVQWHSTVHCTVALYCTLYTTVQSCSVLFHCTLHTVPFSVQCGEVCTTLLYTLHCDAVCEALTAHSTLLSVVCTVVQCSVCSVQCAVYSVQCAVCSVQCAGHSLLTLLPPTLPTLGLDGL